MSMTLLIGLATLFFAIGVIFIVKGASQEEESAVPIENPREIAELKRPFVSASPVVSAVSAPVIDEMQVMLQKERQERIDRLKEENEQLKTLIAEHKARFNELERHVELHNKEHHQTKNLEVEKIKNLEEKISSILMEKDKLLLNQKLFDELKEKAVYFEKQYAENLARQEEMKASIQRLQLERDELFKSQRQSVDRSEFDALNHRLEGSISTIEILKGKNKNLEEMNGDLRSNFKQTEELNARLIEKEKFIQYELAKNRAQALGLEKICEDFKRQIERESNIALQSH